MRPVNEPQATCALHFDAPAAATCSRCGRFSCVTCLASTEPPLCATCAPSVMDPFDVQRRSFELTHALLASLRITWAELPKLAVLALLFAVPAAALQTALVPAGDDLKAIAASMRVSNFYDLFIGIIGAQAMMALLIARAEGRALSLGGALRASTGLWSRAVGAQFRSSLWIGLGLVLLVVPGLWKVTTLMFTSVAVLRMPRRDALEVSESLVKGQFSRCLGFGVVVLSVFLVPLFAGSMVLSIVTEDLATPRYLGEFLSEFTNRFMMNGALSSALYVGFLMLHRSGGVELPPMVWREEPPLQTTS